MSPRLRSLSGAEVVAILGDFGFVVHARRGSHVKLRRISPAGIAETLTVPDHREIDRGTLRAIMRQAGRYIPEPELRRNFYSA